jgi:hypothetical protein
MDISDYKSKILKKIENEKGVLDPDSNELVELAQNEKAVDELIESLKQPGQSDQSKQSTLDLLNTIKVFSPVLSKKMSEFKDALRGLLDSQSPNLRQKAFSSLAIMKDSVAQQRLRADLLSGKNEKDKLVPTHQAIAMLGFDEKALDIPLLKQLVENPPDKLSLIEAVRHIPSNDETFELLKKLMEDKSNPIEVRSMVPDLINKTNPIEFLESANKILNDKGTSFDLIPSLASGVAGILAKGLMSPMSLMSMKILFEQVIKKAPEDIKSSVINILNSEQFSKE